MSEVPVIPQANIDFLKSNPAVNKPVFDKLYGAGAADRVLNGTQRVNPNRKPTPDDIEEDNESWVGWAFGETLGAVGYGVQTMTNETVKSAESFDEWISESVIPNVPTRLVLGFDDNGEFQFGLKTYSEAIEMGATKDYLLGGELGVDRDTREINMVEAPETVVGLGIAGISQFVSGLVGVGKFTKLKGVYGAFVNGAIVDAAMFNPNDPNLTGMLNDFGVDTGAFGELMATDIDDPEWKNRLRNAGEGVLIGGIVEAIAYGVRAKKLAASGRMEEAAEATRAAVKASREIEAELVKSGKALSDDIGETLTLADMVKNLDTGKILKGILDEIEGTPMTVKSVPAEKARRLTPDEVELIREVAGIKSIAKNNNPKITPNLAEGLGITRPGAIKSWDDMLPLMASIRQVIRKDWDVANPGATTNKMTEFQAMKAAREMAELTGEEPKVLYARFAGGFSDVNKMHVEMAARGYVVKALMGRVNRMEDYIASGKWDPKYWKGYRNRDDLIDDYQNSVTLAAALSKEYSATRSAVGRTLQALKVDASDAVKLNQIGEMRGDAEMFAKARAEARSEGKKAPLEEIKKEVSTWRKTLDAINAYRVNALLSGPGTQEVNFISTLLQTIKIPTEQVLGGAMKRDARIVRHGLRTIRGMIASSYDAVAMATEAWKQSDAVLDTINKVEDDARAEIPKVLQLPSRMLLAMDELFKQSAYRGRVIADALEAADVALLKGKERDDFVRGYLADSFDENGKGTRPDALLQAQKSTFTQPLEVGSWGKTIQDKAAKSPYVRFVVPFVRTPINILSEATQMMPIVNRVSRRRRDDLAAGGLRAAQSNGKLAIGYAASLGMAWLAIDDRITGSGPKDPELKKAWLAAGNRPYSIKFEQEDGSIRWVSYARYEPVAQLAAIAADWVEISKNEYGEYARGELWAVAQSMAMSFAENSVNKTFTQGIHDFFTILSGKDPQAAERALMNMGASFVPNILNQTNGDELYRETRTFMDTIMARTPGYGSVDPRRNILGEAIIRPNPKYDPMSLMTQDIAPNDPVTRQIWEVAKGAQSVAGNPSRFLDGFPKEPNGKIDLSKIPYKEGQSLYDRYLELIGTVKINGRTLRQELDRLFKSDQYKNMMPGTDGMTKGTRAYAIQKVLGAYRKKAESELPELVELKRTAKDQQRRMMFEWRKERSGNRPALLFPNASN
jgi:hypothetical protein